MEKMRVLNVSHTGAIPIQKWSSERHNSKQHAKKRSPVSNLPSSAFVEGMLLFITFMHNRPV